VFWDLCCQLLFLFPESVCVVVIQKIEKHKAPPPTKETNQTATKTPK